MTNSRRFVCLIVAVLGFTFFPGLVESKGAIGVSEMQYLIADGMDLSATSGHF